MEEKKKVIKVVALSAPFFMIANLLYFQLVKPKLEKKYTYVAKNSYSISAIGKIENDKKYESYGVYEKDINRDYETCYLYIYGPWGITDKGYNRDVFKTKIDEETSKEIINDDFNIDFESMMSSLHFEKEVEKVSSISNEDKKFNWYKTEIRYVSYDKNDKIVENKKAMPFKIIEYFG